MSILKRAANEFQLVAVNQTLCRDIAKYITASEREQQMNFSWLR
jgi:hypothetical protein